MFSQPAKQVEEEDEIEIDQKRLPTDYDPATFDPTEHCSPPTERVWRLVDEMSSLTLVEVAELSSIMMKKMGMKEPPVVAVMKQGAAGVSGVAAKGQTAAKEETKPEKSIFELKLDSFEAASKIKIIKEVRTDTVSTTYKYVFFSQRQSFDLGFGLGICKVLDQVSGDCGEDEERERERA
ncbi:putative mitochondrial carrier domain protein [Helianthus annuus]|uniref:Mitochondrial carrier domain protein n=1 Tax=Helianthus annuus TaxID=4232 RepID=A0A251S5N0_HELAN|nr:putative mitochondrial carrier domain protein [Helianthus annuus]KAJ0642027.1 putative ribosomal protein L7/L12 [Helianthus annuus]